MNAHQYVYGSAERLESRVDLLLVDVDLFKAVLFFAWYVACCVAEPWVLLCERERERGGEGGRGRGRGRGREAKF